MGECISFLVEIVYHCCRVIFNEKKTKYILGLPFSAPIPAQHDPFDSIHNFGFIAKSFLFRRGTLVVFFLVIQVKSPHLSDSKLVDFLLLFRTDCMLVDHVI